MLTMPTTYRTIISKHTVTASFDGQKMRWQVYPSQKMPTAIFSQPFMCMNETNLYLTLSIQSMSV